MRGHRRDGRPGAPARYELPFDSRVLRDGEHRLAVQAVDAAGHSAAGPNALRADWDPPRDPRVGAHRPG
ncbi:MAG: hypothetical protein HY554_06380 [Elusimicrobia bacterium]|nr:hypothetical protein [Elusimicrobiota bacterium]